VRIHLDTDIGGDTDDACALAMLLGMPDVELVGVTTVHDPDDRRAGYAHRILELADRTDVPVGVGSSPSLTTGTMPGELADELRYWGEPVLPRRSPDALDVLRASIAAGATVVAIGPFTNLALIGAELGRVPVVLMGGWDRYPDGGLPQWSAEMDWNVACDPDAADVVAAAAGELTVVPLAVTMRAQLCRSHLDRLRAAGQLGALLARQAVEHARDYGRRDELLNYQYDSVACLAALGSSCVTVEPGSLASIVDIAGDRPIRMVTRVDPVAFTDMWLSAVEHASSQ
jgi:inosine-uridine nucleoside N-ribohydrolase